MSKRPIIILTMKQIKRMLAAYDAYRTGPNVKGPKPDGRVGNVLRVMLDAGVRVGEALALRKGDVHPPIEPGATWLISINGTIVQPDKGPVFR